MKRYNISTTVHGDACLQQWYNGEIVLYEDHEKSIADLRAKLQQAEEERDGLKHRLELATNAYLAHKDKDAVELKKALATKEAELDRYKRMIEPILAVNAAVTCGDTYPCVFAKACREAVRRLEGEGPPKVTESVTEEE